MSFSLIHNIQSENLVITRCVSCIKKKEKKKVFFRYKIQTLHTYSYYTKSLGKIGLDNIIRTLSTQRLSQLETRITNLRTILTIIISLLVFQVIVRRIHRVSVENLVCRLFNRIAPNLLKKSEKNKGTRFP